MNPNTEVTVDAAKLSRGLKTTFEGVAIIFDSLGTRAELPDIPTQKESVAAKPQAEPSAQDETPVKTVRDTIPEPTPEFQPKPEPEPVPEQPPTASSLTLDDITKVIVGKIKQNRSNNEKIEKLVQSFGVATVKQIPSEKYEVFMTGLASI